MSKNKSSGKADTTKENETDNIEKEATEIKKNTAVNESSHEQPDSEAQKKEKPVRPRKRRIMRNIQLAATFFITLAALAFVVCWGVFFDQNILGSWTTSVSGEYTDTYENAESPDVIETVTSQYNSSMTYEFLEDGVCNVTLGTMTAVGTYEIASTKENGNILSAAVFYESSPIFYGTYTYSVKGNALTGRKLVLENLYYEEDPISLEKGEADDPLKPFDDPKLDDKLTGRWYDAENGSTYEFTEDGHMNRYDDSGFSVRHYYTVMQDNIILVKYFGDEEQSYTYGYEFAEGTLYINGYPMSKLDEKTGT